MKTLAYEVIRTRKEIQILTDRFSEMADKYYNLQKAMNDVDLLSLQNYIRILEAKVQHTLIKENAKYKY